MISIIVPAHNEAATIHDAVSALIQQRTAIPYQIIVVANGCTDETADIVRALAPVADARTGVELTLIDTPQGGKINALNRGDEKARFETRIYCDGDLVVTDNLVDETARVLDRPAPTFVSYTLEPVQAASFVTRAYARMWGRLPLLAKKAHGIAIYGVNGAGRARWGAYPQIVADDNFARLNFSEAERVRLHPVSYAFAMPEGLSELLDVRTRWARGNEELAQKRPDLMANEDQGNRYEGFLGQALRHPVDFAVFLLVYLYGAVQGRLKAAQGNASWERASKSRKSR